MKGKKYSEEQRVSRMLADEKRSEPMSRAASGGDRGGNMVPGSAPKTHLGRSKSAAPIIIINQGADSDALKEMHNSGLEKGAMLGAALAKGAGGQPPPMILEGPMPPMAGPPQGPMMPPGAGGPMPPKPQMPPGPPMQSGAGPAPMPPMKHGGLVGGAGGGLGRLRKARGY